MRLGGALSLLLAVHACILAAKYPLKNVVLIEEGAHPLHTLCTITLTSSAFNPRLFVIITIALNTQIQNSAARKFSVNLVVRELLRCEGDYFMFS